MAREVILVVDDEVSIRTALKAAFKREDIIVVEASDGDEALTLLKKHQFSLVILDVMMKRVGGYEVIQAMRAAGNHTPVMMLSGKSNETDQVLGLGFGADCYLTKPFHVSVLIQNAKALIRRNRQYSVHNGTKICRGPFTADMEKMECFKDGQALNLSIRETTLFFFLLTHPKQVFTKEQLYQQVWNNSIVDDNTITVYVKRLREKIEADSKNPVFLKTVRGIGYRFDIEE